MRFTTPIEIATWTKSIDHRCKLISIGSCFAENISLKLKAGGFNICSNPFGVLFNPLSIADCISILSSGRVFAREDLRVNGDIWSSFSFHGSFNSTDPELALSKMNSAVQKGGDALSASNVVFITFGTSWIYETRDTRATVANCHKFPASQFSRRRLGIDEITRTYCKLLSTVLKDKEVVFTVSPVRHIKDGLHENNLSKSILLLSVEQIVSHCENAHYFPSYEIVMDELRDYRFYDRDMVHISTQAIDYIWERFVHTALSREAQELSTEVSSVNSALLHRPMFPESASYKKFRTELKERCAGLKQRHPYLIIPALEDEC